MLKEVHTVLPAFDLQRARAYYRDKLGVQPTAERGPNLVFHLPSGHFEIYETPHAGTAQNTQMGWETDDLEAEMATMRARGVVFEEYDHPELTTVNGVMEADGMRLAWFRDSEGNYICLSQTL